ncbi:HGxxPAAW family protein [Arthrobacter sp. H20]|uniref:HGxxPAAW family protein n=1 Tax=Arthrobacter sp. H20 TaxID=1267981 RepID=UPI00047A5F19|nr:HGxxPAAW family protein [Arthrobacter sp. H20]
MAKDATANAATRNASTEHPENSIENHASMHDETLGHGNSPAAWTCVLIMLAGAAVSSFAYVFSSTEGNFTAGTVLFWIGIAVMVVGLAAGFVMKRAGFGVGGSRLNEKDD